MSSVRLRTPVRDLPGRETQTLQSAPSSRGDTSLCMAGRRRIRIVGSAIRKNEYQAK